MQSQPGNSKVNKLKSLYGQQFKGTKEYKPVKATAILSQGEVDGDGIIQMADD